MASIMRGGLILLASTGLLAATIGLATSGDAEARPPVDGVVRPMQRSFEVRVESATGGELPTFQHRGETWVLGEAGERYQIRVVNRSERRVEAVISVDGRDAISGQLASFRTARGYVIEPHGSVVVDGFRRDLDTVAAFRFSGADDSYSARKGTPQNVGVIGVALFEEKVEARIAKRPEADTTPQDRWRGRRSGAGADEPAAEALEPAKEGSSADRKQGRAETARPKARRAPGGWERERPPAPEDRASNIGTGWGEDRFSSVTTVSFQRQSPERPTQVLTLRYDDRTGLEARGIDLGRMRFAQPPAPARPVAFPGDR